MSLTMPFVMVALHLASNLRRYGHELPTVFAIRIEINTPKAKMVGQVDGKIFPRLWFDLLPRFDFERNIAHRAASHEFLSQVYQH